MEEDDGDGESVLGDAAVEGGDDKNGDENREPALGTTMAPLIPTSTSGSEYTACLAGRSTKHTRLRLDTFASIQTKSVIQDGTGLSANGKRLEQLSSS